MAYSLRTAPPPSDGSRTITLTAPDTPAEGAEDARSSDEPELTLRLRGSPSPAPQRRGPRVAWGDDVVDNEGCGKKSSKVCCIYHKPRRFDESSDSESDGDSSSSSSSSSENEDDDKSGGEEDEGRARRVGRGHGHHHHHHHHRGGAHRPEKNAYERIPRTRGKAKTNGVNHV